MLAGDRDPVTLTLRVGTEQLLLELGLVDRVEVSADESSGGARVFVQLDGEGSRLMAAFTGRHVGERMDVLACREQVLTARIQERISSGQLVLTVVSEDAARKIADTIWYGEGCDLYLQ